MVPCAEGVRRRVGNPLAGKATRLRSGSPAPSPAVPCRSGYRAGAVMAICNWLKGRSMRRPKIFELRWTERPELEHHQVRSPRKSRTPDGMQAGTPGGISDYQVVRRDYPDDQPRSVWPRGKTLRTAAPDPAEIELRALAGTTIHDPGCHHR